MSQELLKTAHDIIRMARAAGAEQARAAVYREQDSSVEWRDGQLDRLQQSTTMGVGMSLYVNGRYSTHGTSDLRPEALEGFIREAVAMTRLLAEDPHRRLPDPSRYGGQFAGDLQLYDPQGSAAITGIERRRIAQALEEAVRSAPGADKVISVEAACGNGVGESAMVNSNGMEGTDRRTSFFWSAGATVRDEGDRKPQGDWYSFALRRDRMEPVETIGRLALSRALEGLGEKPRSSGRYPCVLENRIVGRALGGLFAALSGSAIQQQRSFLANRIGETIASPKLTVVDDPHVVLGLGSCLFDEEGMTAQRMPVIEQGVLRNYYLDTYYAAKLGLPPTTGGQTNLVFESGERDLEGLLQAMGTGVLITGFMGGNSNSTTGDFSIGIRGHWIESGRRVQPLAEMNLSGNHLEVWKHLVESGADVWEKSSVRAPSLRFDELQFSGA